MDEWMKRMKTPANRQTNLPRSLRWPATLQPVAQTSGLCALTISRSSRHSFIRPSRRSIAKSSALGTALGTMITIFNPELIVLGGFLASLLAADESKLRSHAARVSLTQPILDASIARSTRAYCPPDARRRSTHGGRRRTRVYKPAERPVGIPARPQQLVCNVGTHCGVMRSPQW
jgi:hypothetical protein